MISSKKSYAEQLLQLALALSLLQVDHENVLGRGWDSQLEYRHGNGWELEMLRAVPMTEYPYANRKAMMPLIEDLVRFDRQINNFGDVTAYLLNVQGGQCNQSLSASDLENNTNSGAVALEPTTASFNHTIATSTEADLFLNSEHFEDQVSILDQNLADLTDFGDFAINNLNPYFGLPMKEEPQDNSFNVDFDIKLENNTASTSVFGPMGCVAPLDTNETFCAVPWQQNCNATKKEPNDESEYPVEECVVKSEPVSEDESSEIDCGLESNNNGPFLNNVEVTEEESEIVEVLWKQDVDLGYSLSPSKLAAGTSDINSTKSSPDDVEKLKALEELKLETPKDELDDEWAGIPFTIDNETGEYIRLPLQLDELLQDVLQLAELSTTDQEDISNPVASTSQSSSSSEKVTTKPENLDDLNTNELDAQCDIEISSLFDLENATTTSELSEFSDLDEFDMMIQSASPYHQHHRNGQNYVGTNSAFRQSTGYHQSRVPPLSRGVSMEQRLQDIANLFNPIPGMGVGMGVGEMSPYSHYPSPYPPYQGAHGMPQHSQFTHPAQHPVLHNTSLADLGASQPHYGHNIGSAVTSSMHLTNSSHENDSGATGYKMEHDNMMYYSNSTSELNHTTDGFINSILNDEDLHLMDMNVNEGFCSMRMLDANNTSNNSSVLGSVAGANTGHAASNIHMSIQNSGAGSITNGVMGTDGVVSTGGDRLDASSDSAVSSMGSERVSSLSDVEWGEGSDSAQDYHQGKYGGPYDYSYNSRLNDGTRQPPVAQKKHQMFGKRFFHEPSQMQANLPPTVNPPHSASQLATPIKYEYEPYGNVHPGSSIGHNMEGAVGPVINKDHVMPGTDAKYGGYSLDFTARPPRNPHEIINHNHTYSLPQGTGSNPRPQLRDKRNKKTAEEEHLTRDEKRARSLNVPITVSDIINLPMDEFNERLSKYDLTENQLSLIRDIRRRGKNKVAAQNCRKRKLDQILSLEDEVKEVRKRKEQLYHERDIIVTERRRITNKFATLHRHIFQYLRDSDGNLCSPNEYSLQQAADGSVYLLRKDTHKSDTNNTNNSNGNSTVSTNNNVQNQHQHHPHHHHQQQSHQHSHPQQGPSSTHRHHQPHHHHPHPHHHHKE